MIPTFENGGAGLVERVHAIDRPGLEATLDQEGWALLPRLVSPPQARSLADLYREDSVFRKRVVMARHGFGRGEYKYFDYPLPDPIAEWRAVFYSLLAPIANQWSEALGMTVRFPEGHQDFLARCRSAGQNQATPLLLQYAEGDYNCLHQDLYGDHVFPLQVAILLSEPGVDFSGGEFVLTEQRPRRQSRAEVVPLGLGDAVIFAVRHRPIRGARGFYRAHLRHGVSRVRTGHRRTLGLIFHDANS